MCEESPNHLVGVMLATSFPFIVGPPVLVKLLWFTFTSKKTSDILNFNLALFHIFQCLMSILYLFICFLFTDAKQKVLKFLFPYAQIGGPMNLSFVCMEHYVAVIHPMAYLLLNKYRCREACSVTVWIFTLPISLANILAGEDVSARTKESLRNVPLGVMVVLTAVVLASSVAIARALKRSGPGRDQQHPVERRAFITVCAISSIALVFYIPVMLFKKYQNLAEISYGCTIVPFCIFLLSAASVVHPVFYLHTQGKLFSCSKPQNKT
ncbi:hypothetical protein LDENG_00159000 [Lucifuga dentata]|nr:hypothetical protein LDENG_00159000 [Lucifuga dentata]